MRKDEFIQAVAVELGDDTPKAQIKRVLEAAGDVGLAVINGSDLSVPLFGLGKIVPMQRAARKGRNPKTGAPLDIPAKRGAKYQPGKLAKEALQ